MIGSAQPVDARVEPFRTGQRAPLHVTEIAAYDNTVVRDLIVMCDGEVTPYSPTSPVVVDKGKEVGAYVQYDVKEGISLGPLYLVLGDQKLKMERPLGCGRSGRLQITIVRTHGAQWDAESPGWAEVPTFQPSVDLKSEKSVMKFVALADSQISVRLRSVSTHKTSTSTFTMKAGERGTLVLQCGKDIAFQVNLQNRWNRLLRAQEFIQVLVNGRHMGSFGCEFVE
jgi:hypothetical protein